MKSIVIEFSLIALVFLLISAVNEPKDYPGLIVISNSSVGVSSLSKKEFEKVIQGEQQRWKSGSTVKIALLKTTHPTGLSVAKNVFGMSSNEFNRYWLGLVFEGKCKAPSKFTNEETLIQYVAQTPGAIGVVSSTVKTANVEKIQITD